MDVHLDLLVLTGSTVFPVLFDSFPLYIGICLTLSIPAPSKNEGLNFLVLLYHQYFNWMMEASMEKWKILNSPDSWLSGRSIGHE